MAITIKMAKDMHPDKEIWEQIGFTFTEINHDDILYSTTLPEGWKMETKENSPWINIIDDLGNTRGSMYYQASLYERKSHMNLFCKYKVYGGYLNGDYSKRIIMFGNDEETLFIAGQITSIPGDIKENIERMRKEEMQLKEIARTWANENYPNWQNVDAYWHPRKKEKCKVKELSK